MLVYDQILDRINNYVKYAYVYESGKPKQLIEKFNINNLQSVSYDVSMGDKIRRFKDDIKTINLGIESDVDNLFEEIEISKGYKLKPGEYVLVRLNEKVNMPNDLAAHIRPRTTFNKLGIIITCQHINPSYSGNLQIGIKNETPNTVVLIPELVIGQIVFDTLDGDIREEMLYNNKKSSKYHGENEFVGSKIYDEASVIKANKILNDIFDNLK